MSAVADKIGESMLKHVRVASTEDAQGVVHTEVTGPMGVRLLAPQDLAQGRQDNRLRRSRAA